MGGAESRKVALKVLPSAECPIAVLILVAIGVVGSLVFEKGVSSSSLSGAWRVFSFVSTNVTFVFVLLEEIVDAVTNLVALAAVLPIGDAVDPREGVFIALCNLTLL